MKIGLTTFVGTESSRPGFVAAEAEARGFESIWFPDRSHIPVERRTPWAGEPELPPFHYDASVLR
jgi:alkanesulfonate monooxygenase SsuD/methylene tetrahydromethanopterin reductase-like flavin-dependent oxidoreductase (luciferase family)